ARFSRTGRHNARHRTAQSGRIGMRRFCIIALTSLAVLMAAAPAKSETLKDLLGAWTLVSLAIEQGDKRIESYGPNPKGAMVNDARGRFSITIVRADLPKVASNNRETSTPEERAKILHGSI